MNRFDEAMAQHNIRMSDAANVTIVYHRGESQVIITNAVAGRYPFKVFDQGNMRVEWSERDYLFPATALVIDTVQVTPQERDWIEETINGVVKTFRPAAPTGEQIWRYSDTEETRIRLHCAKWIRVPE